MGKQLLGNLELNRIYQMDCVEGMKLLPDKSVDLICIDPPYNIGKDKWDKWKTVDDYVQFMGNVFTECERVLKDNGSFYFFHNDFRQMRRLDDWMEQNTKFVFKQMVVWNKRFDEASNKGFLDGFVCVDGLRNYQQMAEYCLFYTFDDETGLKAIMEDRTLFKSLKEYFWSEYDEAGLTIKKANEIMGLSTTGANLAGELFGRNRDRFCFPSKERYEKLQTTGYFQRPYDDVKKEYDNLRNEYDFLREKHEKENRYIFNNQKTHHSVWEYEIAPKQGHITPKPVDLIQNIILHSSNECDVVLDCFMGSGTTAVAAIKTKRNFIGFETEPKYIEIANIRIDAIEDLIEEELE